MPSMSRGRIGRLAQLLTLTLAFLAHAAFAPSSRAQDEPDRAARLHFETGASYYQAGNYADALREFQRAYELSHRVQLFHNYSRCYEHLGDFQNAVVYLRRYLEEVEEVPDRAVLELRLANLERRAQETASSPPEDADTSPAPAAAGGSPTPVGAIALYGVAGAALISTAVFGGLTIAEHSALQADCGATRSCSEEQLGDMRAFALVSDISLGLTIAAAAAGTVLLIVELGSGSSESSAGAPTVVPYATADGAGVLVGGAL